MAWHAVYDLLAPAKLNLFLHVVGQRADGYHELQSVFVLIDWCDRLHLERRDDGQLHRHDIGAALPADDLCLRAAQRLKAVSGCAFGVDIHIDKQVPWGAGLGGGSSDAATVLLGLNRLWGLDWPRERLATLALGLGADVPFFVGGRSAWVEGVGERLTPVQLPEQAYAVLKPTVAIPTASIFGAPDLVRNTPRAILSGFPGERSSGGASRALQQSVLEGPVLEASILEASALNAPALVVSALELAAGFGHNDLEPVAVRVAPDVAAALALLRQSCGNGRMTGSGSAVFARVGTGVTASTAIPRDLPAGWVGRLCQGWLEHPLVGWADDHDG
jgi:4-diphosphocytidyl-2-C-methyl-D-erythritol kinase